MTTKLPTPVAILVFGLGLTHCGDDDVIYGANSVLSFAPDGCGTSGVCERVAKDDGSDRISFDIAWNSTPQAGEGGTFPSEVTAFLTIRGDALAEAKADPVEVPLVDADGDRNFEGTYTLATAAPGSARVTVKVLTDVEERLVEILPREATALKWSTRGPDCFEPGATDTEHFSQTVQVEGVAGQLPTRVMWSATEPAVLATESTDVVAGASDAPATATVNGFIPGGTPADANAFTITAKAGGVSLSRVVAPCPRAR